MFGGWIAYTAFDRMGARTEGRRALCVELLKTEWPGLSVRRVRPPEGLKLLVGWTATPASTSRLVDGVQSRKTRGGMDYPQFLAESAAASPRSSTH